MSTSASGFVVDSRLTGQVIARMNLMEDFIADAVLPYVPVNSTTYKYVDVPPGRYYQVPDTKVNQRGQVAETDYRESEQSGICVGHALDEAVAIEDQESQTARDLAGEAVSRKTYELMLAREIRVAARVFALASYPASNRVTLTGTDQFSSTGDPVLLIENALAVPVMRPNTIVFGHAAWRAFRRNAAVVSAIFGAGSAENRRATQEQVAQLFGVRQVLVGMSKFAGAKIEAPGAANIGDVWTDDCALLHINPNVNTLQPMATFGWTARFGTPYGATFFDPKRGAKGSTIVRAAQYIDERIVASDLGYLFKDCVA